MHYIMNTLEYTSRACRVPTTPARTTPNHGRRRGADTAVVMTTTATTAGGWPWRHLARMDGGVPLAVASQEEQAAGALGQHKLADLVAAFDECGLAVIENVVPLRVIEQLRPRMLADAAALSERKGWEARGTTGNGHLQMGSPKIAPWVHAETVANRLVEQIAVAVVGRSAVDGPVRPGNALLPETLSAAAPLPQTLSADASAAKVWLGFHNGNCATKFAGPHAGNSGFQTLHTDGGWTYQTREEAAASGQQWPHLTTCLHINFSVVDVTELNGPEVWPGSHRVYSGVHREKLQDEEFLAARAAICPPVRATYRKGAIALKDCRIWHRGAPNTSPENRPSVVLVYNAAGTPHQGSPGDARNTHPIVFSKSAQNAFARHNPLVHRNAEFIDGPVNHLAGSHSPGGTVAGAPDPGFLGVLSKL